MHARIHVTIKGDRSAHTHVPSISLPDFYLSTPRMVMSVIIMQCVARKQIGYKPFSRPFIRSMLSSLGRARGPSGVVARGATIEQCAQHVQESEVTRLVFIRSDAPVFVVFVQ